MRGILLLWGVIAASSALPASAGTLYKCLGADGVPSYVSKRVSGAQCQVVSHYTPSSAHSQISTASQPSTPKLNGSEVLGVAASNAPTPATAVGASTAALVADASAAAVPASATAAARPNSGGTRRVVSGQVYSYIKDGVRHYTSSKPKGAASVASVRTIKYSFIETCFACGNPGVNFGRLRLNTTAYQNEIAAASREFGVEEAVLRAIMHAESSYNPMALSHAGAQGLMQLMPGTARRFGVTDAYNASQNIRGGAQYLAWLLKRFNGNLTLAAAGYNAGEGAVDRHGGVPPYRETQRYVERVAVLAERYRGAVAAR
jgi:soluble lytic murein transglycosylase-like protein